MTVGDIGSGIFASVWQAVKSAPVSTPKEIFAVSDKF